MACPSTPPTAQALYRPSVSTPYATEHHRLLDAFEYPTEWRGAFSGAEAVHANGARIFCRQEYGRVTFRSAHFEQILVSCKETELPFGAESGAIWISQRLGVSGLARESALQAHVQQLWNGWPCALSYPEVSLQLLSSGTLVFMEPNIDLPGYVPAHQTLDGYRLKTHVQQRVATFFDTSPPFFSRMSTSRHGPLPLHMLDRNVWTLPTLGLSAHARAQAQRMYPDLLAHPPDIHATTA